MQNNEINITYSCEETLKKIKEYMADAKSVTLYTSSLNSLTSYSNGIANEIISNLIFSKKRDKKDVSIVSDFYIDKESFTDSKLNRIREFEYRDIPVKIVHKKSAVDKFFANLKEQLNGREFIIVTEGYNSKTSIGFKGDRVYGFSGINRYFGTYQVSGGKFVFGEFGLTRMAGSESDIRGYFNFNIY